MSKRIVILVLVGIVAVISLFFFLRPKPESEEKLNDTRTTLITSVQQVGENLPYTASFAIFTNGTFRIFSASMYHNLSSEVFIEAKNPNIVNVTKKGITWNDFFSTLPMKLTKQCLTTGTGQTFCTNNQGELKFYINARKDDEALNKIIQPGDKLLVSYGTESDEELDSQFAQIPNP